MPCLSFLTPLGHFVFRAMYSVLFHACHLYCNVFSLSGSALRLTLTGPDWVVLVLVFPIT